ncbi:histidine--tRNA ligase [Alphaproteobacteria bacterium]|jgi:histidyl-tRNA synthetase|nr:histidine--tRNA ligase [Alphaproteobacteria bacterium]|tara:strand:- start:1524 stop:2771 length:1248 start_codon:yes stop_codon:yes gene_type:complete
MKNNINLVKGTHDIYGAEMEKFEFIIESFYSVCKKFNFQSIQTPIIEQQELFSRAVGEQTDIVSKEMYSFLDKGEINICLRPEATSGLARFAASNYQSGLMKLVTHGPMFRRERPQKGRYRQFHQINIETIGEKSPYIDFELILVARLLLDELGVIKNKYKLLINSLGSKEDQLSYSKLLKKYLSDFKNQLSETSISRLDKNPLRILDSKDPEDTEILKNAPKISEHLSTESKNYFEQVKKLLNSNEIEFFEEPKLVRGLDYYSHTAFEFQTTEDKRQNAILAGGRYDKLISMISSRDIPGIGWAAGVERLMDLITIEDEKSKSKNKILFAVQDEAYLINNRILKQIYNFKYNHEVRVNKNIKKLFSYADKNNFSFILLIGEEEINSNKIILKDLKNKSQQTFEISKFELKNEIR